MIVVSAMNTYIGFCCSRAPLYTAVSPLFTQQSRPSLHSTVSCLSSPLHSSLAISPISLSFSLPKQAPAISIAVMSDSPVPTPQAMLVHLSKVGSDWFLFGIALGVPISKLRSIEASYLKEGVKRCIMEMLQYWLDTTPAACWQQVTAALEQVDLITLASQVKQKYLWDHSALAVVKSEGVSSSSSSSSSATTAITASELTRSSPPPPPFPAFQPAELSSDAAAEIETDWKIVEELRDLVSDYSLMLTDFREQLKRCDITRAQFFLNNVLNTDIFTSCDNIEQLLYQLCHRYVDTFNVYYLQKLATCLKRNDANKLVQQYEEKKNKFLKETTVLDFHKAIISKVPVVPKGMAKITIRIPKELATDKILKDMEELAIKAFGDSYHSRFVQFHVIAGSVVICWFVVESLCEVLQQLALEKVAVWRQHGVEEVMVGSQCVYCSICKTEEAVEQYHHYSQAKKRERGGADDSDCETVAKTIKTELRTSSSEEEFEDVKVPPLKTETCKIKEYLGLAAVKTQVKCEVAKEIEKEISGDLDVTMLKTKVSELLEQETELKKRIVDLEEFIRSPASLIQVTGNSGQVITAGNKTSIELRTSSQTSTPLPLPIDKISCQLTDPRHQHVPCSITSTQPGVCTVTYIPTLRGPHQLRIAINETDIPGSPFTLHVLPSPEMRGVVQRTITGVSSPGDVAVSKSGEVVVTEFHSCCSVYNREGEKLWSFATQCSPTLASCIASSSDNLFLVGDSINNQIKVFTMEGRFCTSVGQNGNGPLQFNWPRGISVHPSGRVFVADTRNHRIQVLHHDLTYSHMFGSEGSALEQFRNPKDVACGSSGVVYVTDCNNHRVQLFSTDGQFISSFGSEGSQHGQLFYPHGICVDSTNTVYVTDENNRVSVYTSSGQFIKCFGTEGIGDGELNAPRGVAVSNTTGALYVCDYCNNRVVVY